MIVDELQVPLDQPQHPLTLYYAHSFKAGAAYWDYFQLAKTNVLFARAHGYELEERFWSRLETERQKFAFELRTLTGDIDLIVDAPSNSGLHRAVVAAVVNTHPESSVIRFTKGTILSSLKKNRKVIAETLVGPNSVVVRHEKAHLRRVLIVDDVFSEGNIATIVIDKLLAFGIQPNARFQLAAPLRILHEVTPVAACSGPS